MRQRLLFGIAQSCAAGGYRACTVEDVLVRSNTSREEFDVRFKSLDDCLEAAFSGYVNAFLTSATSQYSPDKPLFQVVIDALAGILDLLESSPAYARMVFLECRTATPRTEQLYRSVVDVMTSLLEQLRVDSPPGIEPPASAARTAVGGVESMIRDELISGQHGLPELLSSAVYCSLVSFLGQEEALLRSRSARSPRLT